MPASLDTLMAGAHLGFSGGCRPPFVEAIRDNPRRLPEPRPA